MTDKKNTEKLYDLSQLRDAAQGNQQFIDKMVGIFTDQVPTALQDIQNAFAANDFNKIMQVAHKIKPMIDMMGIVSLQKEVRRLEKDADKIEDRNELSTLIHNLVNILGQVVDSLQKK